MSTKEAVAKNIYFFMCPLKGCYLFQIIQQPQSQQFFFLTFLVIITNLIMSVSVRIDFSLFYVKYFTYSSNFQLPQKTPLNPSTPPCLKHRHPNSLNAQIPQPPSTMIPQITCHLALIPGP